MNFKFREVVSELMDASKSTDHASINYMQILNSMIEIQDLSIGEMYSLLTKVIAVDHLVAEVYSGQSEVKMTSVIASLGGWSSVPQRAFIMTLSKTHQALAPDNTHEWCFKGDGPIIDEKKMTDVIDMIGDWHVNSGGTKLRFNAEYECTLILLGEIYNHLSLRCEEISKYGELMMRIMSYMDTIKSKIPVQNKVYSVRAKMISQTEMDPPQKSVEVVASDMAVALAKYHDEFPSSEWLVVEIQLCRLESI